MSWPGVSSGVRPSRTRSPRSAWQTARVSLSPSAPSQPWRWMSTPRDTPTTHFLGDETDRFWLPHERLDHEGVERGVAGSPWGVVTSISSCSQLEVSWGMAPSTTSQSTMATAATILCCPHVRALGMVILLPTHQSPRVCASVVSVFAVVSSLTQPCY